jgi:acyl-CoA thioester hydrolase
MPKSMTRRFRRNATMTTRSDFHFIHSLRVRWAEVDLQRVVFNGNYLLYFDVAFTEYWRATGLPDPLAQQKDGYELFVRKAEIEYLGSATFDDMIDIGVRCEKLGRSSMTIKLAIFREDELLIEGAMVYVYADTHAKKAVAIPDEWRKRITALNSSN